MKREGRGEYTTTRDVPLLHSLELPHISTQHRVQCACGALAWFSNERLISGEMINVERN